MIAYHAAMLTDPQRAGMIDQIRRFPVELREAVAGLIDAQLTSHPLTNEWSVAQNVHHLADSHMNSFIRLKLILTETNPTIRPYDQDAWAQQPDANTADLSTSLALLEGLHARWTMLFESLTAQQRQCTGVHPTGGIITPDTLLQAYDEHCKAHLDQIARTKAAL